MSSSRKTKIRAFHQEIFVLVDGESEQQYLKALKQTEKLSLKINPALISKSKTMETQFEAIEAAFESGYDKVFWLFDFDVVYKESRDGANNGLKLQAFSNYKNKFNKLAKEKKKPDSKMLIMNPCFEFWVLLHHKQTDRCFSNYDEVVKELKKHSPDYKKANSNLYEQLKPHIEKALHHESKLSRDDGNIQARADIADLFKDNFTLLK